MNRLNNIGKGSWLTNDNVLEVIQLNENINGEGSITVGWNSPDDGYLPVGLTLDDLGYKGYVLLAPYCPTRNSDGSYRYEPKFSSPVALLGKAYFSQTVRGYEPNEDSSVEGTGKNVVLYAFNFTGNASTIIANLASAAGVTCVDGDGSEINSETFGTISVAFDLDTFKSAAEKIGDALGVSVWYTHANGHVTIHFGTPSNIAYRSGEYYNRFIALGGLTNMTKRITTSQGQEYAAVTQRLTLDPETYPNSLYVPEGRENEPPMTKILTFDDIFPRVRMRISAVHERRCYLLDENGEKIQTGTENGLPVYAMYSKWYIKLASISGEGTVDVSNLNIIDGQTLRIQFLPFKDGGTSKLAGYEFELVHFTNQNGTWEHDIDDVDANGYTAAKDEFRIVFNADGSTILPSTSEQRIIPAENDIVTLINVAVPDSCVTEARTRLLAAVRDAAAPYSGDPVSYTVENVEEEHLPDLGSKSGTYMVTAISTDLITGLSSVTYGSTDNKGLIASLADKIENAQTSGGGSTSEASKVGTMSSEQWRALQRAGGNLGIVRTNERVTTNEGTLADLSADLAIVKEQADHQFDTWFGQGAPYPLEDDDATVPEGHNTSPAIDWNTTEKKELHLQDLYYDMTREPSENGGNVWRWSKSEDGGVTSYFWKLITDADTRAAYEAINDVAADGKLTGGAEKLRVLIDWTRAAEEYASNYEKNSDLGLAEWDEYEKAFKLLCRFLNNDAELFRISVVNDNEVMENENGEEITEIPIPILLRGNNLYVTSDVSFTIIDDDNNEKNYYDCWADYNIAHANFTLAVIHHAEEEAATAMNTVQAMGDDDILTPSEKQDLLREWQSVYNEFGDLTLRAGRSHLPTNTGTTYDLYLTAYRRLYTYLNNPEDYPDNIIATNPASTPEMLESEGNTTINGSVFNSLWSDYYARRSNLLSAISTKHQTTFTGVSVPDAPYYEGDLWAKENAVTQTFERLLICVNTCTNRGQENANDWRKYSINVSDIRVLMGNLIEKAYSLFSKFLTTDDHEIYIYLGGSERASSGFLWYDPNDGEAYVGNSNMWVLVEDVVLNDAFRSVYDLIGERQIRVTNIRTTYTFNKYDIYVNPLMLSFFGYDFEGAVEIMMFNGERWELLSKSVNSVIENLGNMILQLVYGSDGADYVTGAGSLISQYAAKMFAEAMVYDPDTGQYRSLTQALFGVSVYKDSNGNWRSSGKLSADLIEFMGKTVINGKFVIDEDGNVTLADATVKGNLYTPLLRIDEDNFARYCIMGQFVGRVNLARTGMNIHFDLKSSPSYSQVSQDKWTVVFNANVRRLTLVLPAEEEMVGANIHLLNTSSLSAGEYVTIDVSDYYNDSHQHDLGDIAYGEYAHLMCIQIGSGDNAYCRWIIVGKRAVFS